MNSKTIFLVFMGLAILLSLAVNARASLFDYSCHDADLNRDGVINDSDTNLLTEWYTKYPNPNPDPGVIERCGENEGGACYYHPSVCDVTNDYCGYADINRDGLVDNNDVTIFNLLYPRHGESNICEVNSTFIAPGKPMQFNNGNVLISLGGDTSGEVNVTALTSQPSGTPVFSLLGLGKYLQIETDVTSDISGTEIRIYYTDAEVSAAGLDEASLRIYYYNSTSDSWQIYDALDGGVNTSENYVWAKTNHFSIFGVFGNAPVSSPVADSVTTTTTTSGGGYSCTYNPNYDWNCSKWSDCVNGAQTRTCKARNNCGSTYGKPAEKQACMVTAETTVPAETTPSEVTPDKTATAGGTSGMTGAVTGILGKGIGVVIIVFIVLVVAGAITLSIVRRKREF